MKYSVIKAPISLEQKKLRWETLDYPLHMSKQEYLNSEVYDYEVLMKCLRCAREELLDYGFALEFAEMANEDYPTIVCGTCADRRKNGEMVPIDIYNIKKKIKTKK